MKRIILIAATAALTLASCEFSSNNQSVASQAREDSLQNVIDQQQNDMNELMGTFAEINEGFNQINEAEGRVNTLNQNVEGNSAEANIVENMRFIEETLEANRQKIEELQKKINESTSATAKMKAMVDQLTEQLAAKTQEIENLRSQLAERDIRIEKLDSTMNDLKQENVKVKAESESNAQIAKNQDTQLNTAYYMYGTSKELKEHNILVSGEVLQSNNFDKDYFTKIDIRNTTVIPLHEKSAKILTSHPANTYTLLKDSKGEYTLRITDPHKFWSVSKYLVIKVK